MVGWLSGTGLAITGKLEKQGKLCPFVMGNIHFRLAGGLSPLSAGHDSRVGHDKGGIRAWFSLSVVGGANVL